MQTSQTFFYEDIRDIIEEFNLEDLAKIGEVKTIFKSTGRDAKGVSLNGHLNL